MAADEILALAADLSAMGPKLVRPMRGTFDAIGEMTAQKWADIARTTAGKHGKHYPKSIDHDFFGLGIGVEVGPNRGKLQGSMGRGFEFGSVNQPPHLDGLKAVEQMTPIAERMIAEAIEGVIHGGGGGGTGLQEYTTKAGVTRMATPAQIANWTRGSR